MRHDHTVYTLYFLQVLGRMKIRDSWDNYNCKFSGFLNTVCNIFAMQNMFYYSYTNVMDYFMLLKKLKLASHENAYSNIFSHFHASLGYALYQIWKLLVQ